MIQRRRQGSNIVHVYYAKFYKVKTNAKKRNIRFDLTREYMDKLYISQKGRCAYTKQRIYFEGKKGQGGTASLDRIDSQKGYVEGNVQWVHKDINAMKWKLTQRDFVNNCKLVAKKTKNRKFS